MPRARLISPEFRTSEAVVAWEVHRRVGKRARRRYPASEAARGPGGQTIENHREAPQPHEAVEAARRDAVERTMRREWGAGDRAAGPPWRIAMAQAIANHSNRAAA